MCSCFVPKYKVTSQFLPCVGAIFSRVMCVQLFCPWKSPTSSQRGLWSQMCHSTAALSCTSPSLCKWDSLTWQLPQCNPCLSICQENIGHSLADRVQCLGWSIMVSVLMGLAPLEWRRYDMKNSLASAECPQCFILLNTAICLLLLYPHLEIS